MGVSIVMGDPQNGWFTMENPNLTLMTWGYPYFTKSSKSSYMLFAYGCLIFQLRLPNLQKIEPSTSNGVSFKNYILAQKYYDTFFIWAP